MESPTLCVISIYYEASSIKHLSQGLDPFILRSWYEKVLNEMELQMIAGKFPLTFSSWCGWWGVAGTFRVHIDKAVCSIFWVIPYLYCNRLVFVTCCNLQSAVNWNPYSQSDYFHIDSKIYTTRSDTIYCKQIHKDCNLQNAIITNSHHQPLCQDVEYHRRIYNFTTELF